MSRHFGLYVYTHIFMCNYILGKLHVVKIIAFNTLQYAQPKLINLCNTCTLFMTVASISSFIHKFA